MIKRLTKLLNNPKFIDKIMPLLVVLLIMQMFLFTFSCVKTSQSAFRYNIKVREKGNEVYQIFENSEVGLNALISSVQQSYDLKNLNNKSYNQSYLDSKSDLVKAVTNGIPFAKSVWFKINSTSSNASVLFERNNRNIIEVNSDILKSHRYLLHNIKPKKYYNSNNKIITISSPIYKQNKLIGFVGVDISTNSMFSALNNIQKEFSGSDVILLDEHNRPIVMCFAKPKKSVEYNLRFLRKYLHKKSKKDNLVVYQEKWGQNTALILKLKNNYKMVMSCPNIIVYAGYTRLQEAIYLFLAVMLLFLVIYLYNKKKIILINRQLEDGISTQKIILNSSPMGIAIKNTRGVYVDCNENFAKMLNIPYEQVIGKDDYSFFDNEAAESIIAKDHYVMFKNEAIHEEEWNVNAIGEKRLLEKYRIPLFDSEKELMGLLITINDVTKKREEKEALRSAKEAAEKATEMKSSFIANMSHEIRTPLNGVLGFLQLLDDTSLNEVQKEFVVNAQKSSELLLNIINEILDISKIEAGRMSIDSMAFNIRSAVEDVTTISSSSEKAAGLNINALIRSDVPNRVLGDPSRVKQILTNLIGNAVKFTKQGEVIIYVSKDKETEDEVFVSFKVKDTGIGIEKDKLDSIFGAFVQADASTTRNFGGTGLGLAISKKLAMLMNGDIKVVSEVNVGSTFTLTIPFKKDLNSSLYTENLSKNLNGISVLVIDDKPTDLRIISHYINDANGIVIEANSVEHAMEILKRKDEDISVILIDSKLQKILDFDMKEVIKIESGKDIPIILYTTLAKRGDAILAKQKGFNGYLTKPIKKHELLEGIAVAISGEKQDLDSNFISKHLIKEIKFDSKVKILVVEDSELNIKLILNILKNYKLNSDIAMNGKDAVDAFKSNHYDLILMDCELPEMDGYEATKRIRSFEGQKSHIPIVAMTANVLNEDREKCYSAGMDDYLSKPINIKELYAKLQKFIKLDVNSDSEEKANTCEDIINQIIEELEFSKEDAYELFNVYLETLPQTILQLRNEIDAENYDDISKIIHKLKGASANLRVERVVVLCNELSASAKEHNVALFMDNLERLKKYFERLVMSFANSKHY